MFLFLLRSRAGQFHPLYLPVKRFGHAMTIDSRDRIWVFGGRQILNNPLLSDLWVRCLLLVASLACCCSSLMFVLCSGV